jgi:tight adherence protein C
MNIVVSSILLGLATGCLAWMLAAVATAPRVVDPQLGRFEEARRTSVRQQSALYRFFEPWIDEMAAEFAERRPELERQLRWQLTASGECAPWLAGERWAVWQIEAVLAAIAAVLFGWFMGGMLLGVAGGIVAFFAYRELRRRELRQRHERRCRTIKRLLAGAVDLLALMLEVGGNFHESLAAVADRHRETPLGDELGRVLGDIDAGRPRKEALQGFAERVADDDVSDLVFAVVQGEELGTPLTSILRNQADQMRQKRSQWAEKAAEEAQVTIVFPAMVIMVACLIIVAAPFVLAAVRA